MSEPPDLAGRRLAGKVAIVVGGGAETEFAGTGSATARLFAAQGAQVAVVGRTEAKTSKTVELIERAGGAGMALIADATKDADCQRAVTDVIDRYGRLDVLVNNVGIPDRVGIEDFDEKVWYAVLDSNLKAPLLMAKHAVAHLRAAGGGSIINTGSIAGLQASGGIAYGTSKGGLIPLTREMAMLLGPDSIRVNCVIPGHLHTPNGVRYGGPEMRLLRRSLTMLDAEGTGWDVAWAILYFASDESRFVTAQSLTVDGGVTNVLGMSQVTRTKGTSDKGADR
jgi:NAD(P)-dependent dehydrogenase (short-subunit alcohol dehydrogenase family)